MSNETQQNLDYLKAQGVDTSRLNDYGNRLDSGEANKILTQFKVDPNSVYRSDNIAQAITNPAPRPDDLLGIKTQLDKQYGVTDLTNQYNSKQTELNNYSLDTTKGINDLNGHLFSTNKIIGEQQLLNNERSLGSQSLAIQLEDLGRRLTSAQGMVSQDYGIKAQQLQTMQTIMANNQGLRST